MIDSFILGELAKGMALPVAVMALALVVGWRLWSPRQERRADEAGASWSLVLGLGAGWVMVKGWPNVPAVSTEDWILWFLLAAGAIGATTGWWQRRIRISMPLRAAVVALMVYLTAGPNTQTNQDVWVIVGLVLVIVLTWVLLDDQRRRLPEPLSLWGLATAAGCGGLAIINGGALPTGMSPGALGQMMGLLFLGVLLLPAKTAGGAPAVFHCVYTACLLLNGYWYAQYVPIWAVAGIFLSPLLGYLYLVPGLARGPAWLRWGLPMLAVLALAMTLAILCNFPPESAEDAYGYGY
ncbi:MAG: hypothetical protein AAGK14_00665 [Verrucomicrobiota bacterium]